MPCLGLDFLAKCSQSQLTDHFLFNLETAVSSLAVIIAIYALFLERRFRVRMDLKNTQWKNLLFLILVVIELTFIAATLPYVPGSPRPLIGYPIFWEIIACLILIYVIIQAYKLPKPIIKLSKRQIGNLIKLAPYNTLSYHGSTDLMVKEADYFWTDFLKKSLTDNSLRKTLIEDFTNNDFLKVAVKSQYILLQTVEVLGKSKPTDYTAHIKNFLRTYFLYSLVTDNSIIISDLKSSYKPITQHIIRIRKLGDVVLGDSTDLFLLQHDLERGDHLRLMERFIKLFELYLGRQYHRTEDDSQYLSLIRPEVLKNFLEFFNDGLHYLKYDEKTIFIKKLSFLFLDLKNLPEQESKILADGIYEILETYASVRNWKKDSDSERLLCINVSHSFIECNQYTEKIFKQRLLEKIVGSENSEKTTHFVCNLNGYYPMMIPVYFFVYGYDLFHKRESVKDFEFHMTILKKMQENLPIISAGRTQGFMNTEVPNNERTKNAIKRKAEDCLDSMFPNNVVYDKKENSLTYYFAGDEASSTLLLNETVQKNQFVFK